MHDEKAGATFSVTPTEICGDECSKVVSLVVAGVGDYLAGSRSSTGFPSGSSSWIYLPPGHFHDFVPKTDTVEAWLCTHLPEAAEAIASHTTLRDRLMLSAKLHRADGPSLLQANRHKRQTPPSLNSLHGDFSGSDSGCIIETADSLDRFRIPAAPWHGQHGCTIEGLTWEPGSHASCCWHCVH
jgi:hypothetical protein